MEQREDGLHDFGQSLSPSFVPPEDLADRMREMFDAISRRASEIFESGGRVSGRDVENWLRAEGELLHTIPIEIVDSEDSLLIRAEVAVFTAQELEMSLEPRKLVICGERQIVKECANGSRALAVSRPDFIYRSVDLPTAVIPQLARATLMGGALEVEMKKVIPAQAPRKETQAA